MNTKTINFLIKIKNASMTFFERVETDSVLFNINILKALYKTGLIQNYELINNKIIVFLRQEFQKPLIKTLRVISTPTKRTLLDYKSICQLKKNSSLTMFFSTDKGILTLAECKKLKTGGLLLFIC